MAGPYEAVNERGLEGAFEKPNRRKDRTANHGDHGSSGSSQGSAVSTPEEPRPPLSSATYPPPIDFEVAEQVTIRPHLEPGVLYSNLSIQWRLGPPCFRIVAEVRHYTDPDAVFRFLDLPPEIRNKVYDMWISQLANGTELVLKDHRQHCIQPQQCKMPCWLPALCRVSKHFWRETFPIFLRQLDVVAHEVSDLHWLHHHFTIIQGVQLKHYCPDRDVRKPDAYRYIQSLTLPCFFSVPGPLHHRRTLELGLFDLCKNITSLRIGFEVDVFTRPITHENDHGMRLRELKQLEEVLDEYGIPHIFTLRCISSLSLVCVDNIEVERNTIDEPLRVFVSIVQWLYEAFRFRLRNDVRITMQVCSGRFDEDGEGIPTHVIPLDGHVLVTELQQLERAVKRHWNFLDEWEMRSRAMIADPWLSTFTGPSSGN